MEMVKYMKAKYILASLVILVFLFVGASCTSALATGSSTPTVYPTTSQSAPLSIVDSSNPSSMPDFVSIIAKVRPSVVAITTTVTGVSFHGRRFTQEGAGSGWIIDKDGIIITNNHVVEGASSVTVTLEDGRTFPAESVHTDPVADLAVVKINAQNLPALQIGDSSNLHVGEWVVAIGNSLGMGISATKGIVSALEVSLPVSPGETLSGLIQTDAAINPGNSGGPLVNLLGEIVGINSAKVAQVGVEGMGYAISIKEAKPVIDQLIKNGYVIRPYLGAELYTVDQFVIFRYSLTVDKGVFVTDVASGSPAYKAGIKPGDVITAGDGKDISSAGELVRILQSHEVGQQIQVTFYHGSVKNTVTATLTQTPPP
jgi:serine protease Do